MSANVTVGDTSLIIKRFPPPFHFNLRFDPMSKLDSTSKVSRFDFRAIVASKMKLIEPVLFGSYQVTFVKELVT